MPIVKGPFGDGFDEEQYNLALEDAQDFFNISREQAQENLDGFRRFKEAAQAHGLTYAYDESDGSIWDLLSVRCTVSNGISERGREALVEKILKSFRITGPIVDFACGIGRELFIALQHDELSFGVERGKTAEFAKWWVERNYGSEVNILSDEQFSRRFTAGSVGAIMCFEYFEHDPSPVYRALQFWDKLRLGGYLICNCRSFNAHDTGHLPQNFKFQGQFEQHLAKLGFECVYFPSANNMWNVQVWKKVPSLLGSYSGHIERLP